MYFKNVYCTRITQNGGDSEETNEIMTISKWNHNFLAFYSGIRNSTGKRISKTNKMWHACFFFGDGQAPVSVLICTSFGVLSRAASRGKQISNRLWQYHSKRGKGAPSTPLSEKDKWPPSRDHYHHNGHRKVLNQKNHQSTANVWQILPTSKYFIRSTCTVEFRYGFLKVSKSLFRIANGGLM